MLAGLLISGFHRLGDRALVPPTLGNRGLAYVYTGRFRQADADLTRAEEMMVQLGQLSHRGHHLPEPRALPPPARATSRPPWRCSTR